MTSAIGGSAQGIVEELQTVAAIVWIAAALGSVIAALAPSRLQHAVFSYGKLAKSSIPSVPKSWFTAFYAWGLAATALFTVAVMLQESPLPRRRASLSDLSLRSLVTLGIIELYGIHLMRRLYECLSVHSFSPTARMPVHLWLAGLAHYTLVPATLIPAVSVAISGWIGISLVLSNLLTVAVAGIALAGLCAVIFGNVAQNWAHRHLARMRTEGSSGTTVQPVVAANDHGRRSSGASKGPQSGSNSRLNDVSEEGTATTARSSNGKRTEAAAADSPPAAAAATAADLARYPLPRGGLFELVLCPHYTAEVAIYAGLAALTLAAGAAGAAGLLPASAAASVVWSSASTAVLVPTSASAPLVVDSWLGWAAGRAAATAAAGAAACLGTTSSDGAAWAAAAEAAVLQHLPLLRAASPLLLLLWVAANLTATARASRRWYEQRVGAPVSEQLPPAICPALCSCGSKRQQGSPAVRSSRT